MIETKPQVFAPWFAHNKSEMGKFLDTRGIKSQWPPVGRQVETLNFTMLFAGGYNPSIIRFQGKLLMAYRFHTDNTAATKLAIAELDDNFGVTGNQELSINDENSAEDPKLFEFGGQLWMSYVSSTWPRFPASTVKYVTLTKPDHWRTSNPVERPYTDRQTMEKNHVPFPCGNKFRIIYRHSPKQIIFTDGEPDMITPALHWPYGEIRGGTVPMLYDGKLLKFFHSSLRNEMPPVRWRYYIGALLMEPEPPFKQIAVSKRPILRGSEVGGDTTRKHFKPNIVFCSGAIEVDGGFMLSVGVNDSQCVLCKVKDLQL